MRSTRLLASLAVAAVSTTGIALGTPAGAQAAPDRPSALEALAAHPGLARATVGQAFSVTDRSVDQDGSTHVRMDRTYRGLPVVGGDLVVHQAPGGSLDAVSQTLKAPLDLSAAPQVDAHAASVKALAPSKLNRSITGQKTTGTPQLLVDATGATPRLAWKVLSGGTQSDGTPSRLATYVDATTGAVLRAEQEIQTAEGSGQSLYSGTVPVQVTLSGSSYLLKDGLRGGSATSDMNNKEDSLMCQIFGSGCTNGTVFASPDLSFGNGTTGSRESAGVDAAYGGAETFDYFKLVHGRNGIFGNGTGAPSRVHYGSGYVNAFWDGSKMTYGDGDGADFGPLVSLDVAGHEMSHGVTENTANLTYSGSPAASTSPPRTSSARWWSSTRTTPTTPATTSSVRSSTSRSTPASAGWTSRAATVRRSTATTRRSASPTCTTRRGWATTSSTCSPRAPAPRPSAAWPTARRPATAPPWPASVATPPRRSGSVRSRPT